jgi:hypothetical protein
MAQFTRSKTWKRWVGTPSTLVTAAQVAQAEVREWPEAEKFSKMGTEVWRDCYTSVEFPGFTMEESTIAVIRDIQPREFRLITSIQCTMGAPYSGVGVIIRLRRGGPALVLSIHGSDRTRVDGLTARLGEIISGDGASPYTVDPWQIAAIALSVILPVAFAALGFQITDLRLLFLIGLGGLAVGIWLGLFIFPDLEIYPEGGSTRFRSLRAWLGAVIASLVAVALWNRFSRPPGP